MIWKIRRSRRDGLVSTSSRPLRLAGSADALKDVHPTHVEVCHAAQVQDEVAPRNASPTASSISCASLTSAPDPPSTQQGFTVCSKCFSLSEEDQPDKGNQDHSTQTDEHRLSPFSVLDFGPAIPLVDRSSGRLRFVSTRVTRQGCTVCSRLLTLAQMRECWGQGRQISRRAPSPLRSIARRRFFPGQLGATTPRRWRDRRPVRRFLGLTDRQ